MIRERVCASACEHGSELLFFFNSNLQSSLNDQDGSQQCSWTGTSLLGSDHQLMQIFFRAWQNVSPATLEAEVPAARLTYMCGILKAHVTSQAKKTTTIILLEPKPNRTVELNVFRLCWTACTWRHGEFQCFAKEKEKFDNWWWTFDKSHCLKTSTCQYLFTAPAGNRK